MKLMKRTNVYKSNNVTFNPETFEALSYDWWCFVKLINGKVVFNSYNYSPTTNKHQYKVRSLLSDLGIKIDFEISCPKGLQDSEYYISIDSYYSDEIKKLNEAIAKPRSQAKKNKEREEQIEKLVKTCVDFKLMTEK